MGNKGSIIDIIQKMVQEGQPQEKILQTLKDLGVNGTIKEVVDC